MYVRICMLLQNQFSNALPKVRVSHGIAGARKSIGATLQAVPIARSAQYEL